MNAASFLFSAEFCLEKHEYDTISGILLIIKFYLLTIYNEKRKNFIDYLFFHLILMSVKTNYKYILVFIDFNTVLENV